jgi:hypothetical protein
MEDAWLVTPLHLLAPMDRFTLHLLTDVIFNCNVS